MDRTNTPPGGGSSQEVAPLVWETVVQAEWGAINPPLFPETEPPPTSITLEEAWAILHTLPVASRQLLAQVVSVYLALEDIPPISFRRDDASAALPLLAARLVKPSWEEDQHMYDAEWGAAPPGLLAVTPEFRLNALVLAILSGAPQDGSLVYDQMRANDATWRVFSLAASVADQ